MPVLKNTRLTIGKRGVEHDLSHIVESVSIEDREGRTEVQVKLRADLDARETERHTTGLEKLKPK